MEIERGIPVPESWGPGRRERYRWRAMKVGDSFLVPLADAQGLAHLAWSAGRRLGRRYVTAKKGGGVRVWRVE